MRRAVPAMAVAALGIVLLGGPVVAAGAQPTAGGGTGGAAGVAGTTTGSADVTTVGTGRTGFGGDGGPARLARLDAPQGLARDGAGDLFIADTGNCRVREVVARGGVSLGPRVAPGDITTVAGGPCGRPRNPPPGALAVDPAGDLFVAYPTGDRVAVIAPRAGRVLGTPVRARVPTVVAGSGPDGSSGNGGPARSDHLDDPSGLAVGPTGELFVADTGHCRVVEVDAGGTLTTVAGTGTCGSAGDGGPATSAQVWDPGSLAVGPDGNVFVADQGNRKVRVLAVTTGTVLGVAVGAGDLATVAGEGSYGPYLNDGFGAVGPTAELNFPSALASDVDGDLLVADGSSHVIRVVGGGGSLRGQSLAPGTLSTVAGARSTGQFQRGTTWIGPRLVDPSALVVDPDGTVVYADAGASVVRALPVADQTAAQRATANS